MVQNGSLFNVPSLPRLYSPPSELLTKLKDVFSDNGFDKDPRLKKQIRYGIGGPSSSGKSLLAASFAHDVNRVLFFDEIIWITLGKESNLLGSLNSLLHMLSGQSYPCTNVEDCTAVLSSLIAYRRILLIVDDVWNIQDLRPFLVVDTIIVTSQYLRLFIHYNIPYLFVSGELNISPEDFLLSEIEQRLDIRVSTVESTKIRKIAVEIGQVYYVLHMISEYCASHMGNRGWLENILDRILDFGTSKGWSDLPRYLGGRAVSIDSNVLFDISRIGDLSKRLLIDLTYLPAHHDIPLETMFCFWTEFGLDQNEAMDALDNAWAFSLLVKINDEIWRFVNRSLYHFCRSQSQNKTLQEHLDDYVKERDYRHERLVYMKSSLIEHIFAAEQYVRLCDLLIFLGCRSHF